MELKGTTCGVSYMRRAGGWSGYDVGDVGVFVGRKLLVITVGDICGSKCGSFGDRHS
jgi:hypothetical protein